MVEPEVKSNNINQSADLHYISAFDDLSTYAKQIFERIESSAL